MTPNRVTVSMEKFAHKIPPDRILIFKDALVEADNDCLDNLMCIKTKSHLATILFSIFLGGLAVDRFYVGDVRGGMGKLFFRIVTMISMILPLLNIILSIIATVWCIADIFIVYKMAREINYDRLIYYLRSHKAKPIYVQESSEA